MKDIFLLLRIFPCVFLLLGSEQYFGKTKVDQLVIYGGQKGNVSRWVILEP